LEHRIKKERLVSLLFKIKMKLELMNVTEETFQIIFRDFDRSVLEEDDKKFAASLTYI
jgi:hypothetical protein